MRGFPFLAVGIATVPHLHIGGQTALARTPIGMTRSGHNGRLHVRKCILDHGIARSFTASSELGRALR